MIFWLTVLGGLSLGLSGLQLIFPFTFQFFDGTFTALNVLGLGLPTRAVADGGAAAGRALARLDGRADDAPMIIAHVYIGSVGMEGAFEAMGSAMST